MATAVALHPRLSLFSIRERNISSFNPSLLRSYGDIGRDRLLRGYCRRGCKKAGLVVKAGLSSENLDDLIRFSSEARSNLGELFSRAEGIIYTVSDAAVSSLDSVTGAAQKQQNGDWLSGITNYLETVLKVLKNGFSALHVPYSYGFAIILLTVIVKAATFPLTKKQVESTMAIRTLQPQVKAIQQRYAGDQERIQLETARLYKLAGVNPLAGCLPTLATVPIWIGLYRALSNVADEGLLTEGFFWIPSLSGPTTIAARQTGSGISWLFPFIDGQPPLGWSDTLAYLVLPVLLVASQYISVQIMQPAQVDDPNQKTSQALTKVLPLMIGYFALSVPSGLSLYWLTNNILSTAQQLWLQKLGGAKNPVRNYDDITISQEKPKLPQSVSNADPQSNQAEAPSVSKGLPPGERFKRIKEEETRRRQQQEEEKRKAEEAAKRAEAISVESSQEAELAKTSSNGLLTLDSVEEKTEITSLETDNGGLNHNNCMEEKDEENSYKNLEKTELNLAREKKIPFFSSVKPSFRGEVVE